VIQLGPSWEKLSCHFILQILRKVPLYWLINKYNNFLKIKIQCSDPKYNLKRKQNYKALVLRRKTQKSFSKKIHHDTQTFSIRLDSGARNKSHSLRSINLLFMISKKPQLHSTHIIIIVHANKMNKTWINQTVIKIIQACISN
jgi:hypothetical protein